MMRTLPLAVLAIAALAACRESNVAEPAASRVAPVVNPEWVNGAARAALDARGRFVLPRTAARGEIDEQQAVALGDAWLKQFGSMVLTTLEEERGSHIALETAQRCGPPLYAASSYGKLTDDIPLPVQQLHGSWWLLSYCNGSGEAQISLSVSALATNITLEDGRVRFPVSHGTEFIWYGIPNSLSGLPVSAERAVAAAFQATRVQVAEVPELVAPPRPNGPYSSLWHIVLERPATLRTTDGAARSTRDLYIRYTGVLDEPTLSVAADVQPAVSSFRIPPAVAMHVGAAGKLERIATVRGETPVPRSWTIARRTGRPLAFEEVRP